MYQIDKAAIFVKYSQYMIMLNNTFSTYYMYTLYNKML